MKNFFYLLYLSLVLSCGIKQPVENGTELDKAKIAVNSSPVGAMIFIDQETTQKLTPDTLSVNPGYHLVQVALDGYKADNDTLVINAIENTISDLHFNMSEIATFGELLLKTIPVNAHVIIDGQPQSKTTPDTFKLSPGNHTILIQKNGYKDILFSTQTILDEQSDLEKHLVPQPAFLLESFANVSCEPCVEATENLENLVQNTNDSTLFIIEYFANWPSANDPFYAVAPEDIMERLTFYGVSGLPEMFSTGSPVNPLSVSAISGAYTAHINEQNNEIGISVEKSLTNDSLIATIEIFQLKETTDLESLILYCAITEDNISFTDPPGSNGLKNFNWVFRGFISNKKGDTFSFNNSQFTTGYSIKWKSEWDYSNIKVIAFLQNKNTKSIKYLGGS